MSMIDEIRGVARAALDQVGQWVDPVGAERSRFDDFIMKAAEAAKAAGNDGTNRESEIEFAGEPQERKALHFDPFDLVAAMGYRERPSPLSYAAMERVGRTVPVIADIINARVNQTVMFCARPDGRHDTGFEVRPKDPDAKMSPADKKRANKLEELLLNCGTPDPDRPYNNLSLVNFAKMFVHDSLTFDQGVFEVVNDRKGRPAYFDIVDASTIRLLDPAYRSAGDTFAVQVINGSIVADFRLDELAFCVRNPRSGIRSHGYGLAETETLVREITGFLWAIDYNRRWFSNGTAARGILNFKGTMPDKQLRAFRRQWYAMMAGVANAWRTPVTNAQEIEWINMQLSNRDMEYSQWMDFLIKVCCARFNIAPEEVQFSYGNTGQSQAMGQSPIEEKIKASKDLGLRPLVMWFWTQLNQHFLSRVDPDFVAVPVGLDDQGAEAEIALLKEKTSIYMTIDEARIAQGEEPLGPDKGGDVIENSVWIQWFNAKQGADQQQQMAQQGAPGTDDAGYMQPDAEPPPGDFSFEDDMDLDEPEPEPEPEPGVEKSQAIRSRRDRAIARYTLDL